MQRKRSLSSIFLLFFLLLGLTLMSQAAFAEMTLNDNVNIEGDVFLEGNGSSINFPDGSRQTTGAIPPWSQKMTTGRFVLVLEDEAVLDQETGLVWQRDTDASVTEDWDNAQTYCYTLELGGRKGWRLPTVDELATLIDSSNNDPCLPTDHPFTNVKSRWYWSSTTYADNTAWRIHFNFGAIQEGDQISELYVRAVRSGR